MSKISELTLRRRKATSHIPSSVRVIPHWSSLEGDFTTRLDSGTNPALDPTTGLIEFTGTPGDPVATLAVVPVTGITEMSATVSRAYQVGAIIEIPVAASIEFGVNALINRYFKDDTPVPGLIAFGSTAVYTTAGFFEFRQLIGGVAKVNDGDLLTAIKYLTIFSDAGVKVHQVFIDTNPKVDSAVLP